MITLKDGRDVSQTLYFSVVNAWNRAVFDDHSLIVEIEKLSRNSLYLINPSSMSVLKRHSLVTNSGEMSWLIKDIILAYMETLQNEST